LACALLLFPFNVTLTFLSPPLLLGEIDNARWCFRPTVAPRFAMIAIINCELGLEQGDGKNFAVPLSGTQITDGSAEPPQHRSKFFWNRFNRQRSYR
jgi:hypothetical protein